MNWGVRIVVFVDDVRV
uniref:Uncharacterized protein n=1 Tax=Rhizophora mucronata TaxID=61149 RepID=A0A2P2NHQ6_RHIMU